MFDIGFSELLLIAVVALVVIGPERLPAVARNVGRFIGRFQRYVQDIKRDFNREIEFEEIRRLQQEMESTVQSMQASVRAVEASLQQEVKPREEVLATSLEQAQQNLDHLKAQVDRLEQGTSHVPTATQLGNAGLMMEEPRPKELRVTKKGENSRGEVEASQSTLAGSAKANDNQYTLF